VSAHPSMLQLDALSLGGEEASTVAHVQGCARCAAYVARVRQELPVPAWVRELDRPPHRAHDSSWLFRSSLVAAVALFAAGGVLVQVKYRGAEQSDRGAKGMPSIAVYIKRDGVVSLWDGQAPVQPGDALQLKVAAGAYSRVTVAALQDGTLRELYAGSAAGEGLLPRSWTVDDAPDPEVLLVAFSRSPLTKAGQEAALATLPRTREIWATRLQLAKRGGNR
jgi:hypothetical protein